MGRSIVFETKPKYRTYVSTWKIDGIGMVVYWTMQGIIARARSHKWTVLLVDYIKAS
jgi:hypothetical protein